MPTITKTHTVVFIHGMYMTPACWAPWEKHFQDKGYRTLAPAWPEHDQPVEVQRKAHPSAKLAALRLEDVVDHYEKLIRSLEEPPLLIGHSMGGLVVQFLLQRGVGAAGIAIDSAPPKGLISLKYSFLKSNWPVISPSAKLDVPIWMTPSDFAYAFVHTLPEAEQRAAYEQHVVPESRRVGKGPTSAAARIDFKKARPPLLLVAGAEDRIIPASLNRSNFDKYKGAPAITDFREFAGRTHWIIAQPGWEEVADFVLGWVAAS